MSLYDQAKARAWTHLSVAPTALEAVLALATVQAYVRYERAREAVQLPEKSPVVICAKGNYMSLISVLRCAVALRLKEEPAINVPMSDTVSITDKLVEHIARIEFGYKKKAST